MRIREVRGDLGVLDTQACIIGGREIGNPPRRKHNTGILLEGHFRSPGGPFRNIFWGLPKVVQWSSG